MYIYLSSKKGCRSWADDTAGCDTLGLFACMTNPLSFGLQEHQLCRHRVCQAAFSIAEPSPEGTCGHFRKTNCAWAGAGQGWAAAFHCLLGGYPCRPRKCGG